VTGPVCDVIVSSLEMAMAMTFEIKIKLPFFRIAARTIEWDDIVYGVLLRSEIDSV
jgi:hypothetical protein